MDGVDAIQNTAIKLVTNLCLENLVETLMTLKTVLL